MRPVSPFVIGASRKREAFRGALCGRSRPYAAIMASAIVTCAMALERPFGATWPQTGFSGGWREPVCSDFSPLGTRNVWTCSR